MGCSMPKLLVTRGSFIYISVGTVWESREFYWHFGLAVNRTD